MTKDGKQEDIKIQGTNWDNTKTIERWIRECDKQEYIYIYDSVLDKIKERSNFVKLLRLIISTISMLLTTSGIGLTDNSNVYIQWTYKILVAILSTIIYGLTSYQKLEKYDDIIEKYNRYTDKIGNFIANIVSISEIKTELRPDGDIYRESPYIKHSHWKDGIISYNNYILNVDNNYCARKRNDIAKYIDNSHVIDIDN